MIEGNLSHAVLYAVVYASPNLIHIIPVWLPQCNLLGEAWWQIIPFTNAHCHIDADVIKWKKNSAQLALCAGNSPVTGEFPSQRPVTRSFDVFFGLRMNKRLSKQSRGWWFGTPSRSFWRHCNGWISCAGQTSGFSSIYDDSWWMVAS